MPNSKNPFSYDDLDGRTITFAESGDIDDYEGIATEFLKKILNINYDECFVSDDSMLSDFAGCCTDDEYRCEGWIAETLPELWAIGDKIIAKKIWAEYGITVTGNDYLVDVFEQIRVNRTKLLS